MNIKIYIYIFMDIWSYPYNILTKYKYDFVQL